MAYDRYAFGDYIRAHRKSSGLPLKLIARKLKLSVTYVSEVELGTRAPLPPKYWPELVEVMPALTLSELEDRATLSRPLEFDLTSCGPHCRQLLLALSRGLQEQTLSDIKCVEMLNALRPEH